eukprot:CAMPEP_0201505214 /NCGR_PEP_ID=MMETSP0151_2-20130828/85623_1 /ASSEMBLY_ACC=CAM_ASM_000257 /TAXON_ID=200890 /ORGANISM="Paramoeba atlantica, Strain 621/1 / CCAP 1560/9" /LENGTH=209 /DNA_ID=CAMNT_0047899043 /DNA_START=35 /DNA_END=664 /DNA_ORIENTATION=+
MDSEQSKKKWDLALLVKKRDDKDPSYHTDLMNDIQEIFVKSGLVIEQESEPRLLFNVSSSPKFMAITAESMRLKKAVISDDDKRRGGGGKKFMKPYEVAYHQHFENSESDEFWLPCERLEILYQMLENVPCPKSFRLKYDLEGVLPQVLSSSSSSSSSSSVPLEGGDGKEGEDEDEVLLLLLLLLVVFLWKGEMEKREKTKTKKMKEKI